MKIKKSIDNLGRITLPKPIRNALELEDGAEVYIELKGKRVILTNPKNDFDLEQYLKEEVMPNLVGNNEVTIGAREMCLRILDRISGIE